MTPNQKANGIIIILVCVAIAIWLPDITRAFFTAAKAVLGT